MLGRIAVEDLHLRLSGRDHLEFSSAELGFSDHRRLLILRGDNGSGKTTFLNVLSGHVTPYRGRVIFDGHQLSGRSPAWAAKNGVVRAFQSPLLCNELKVWENIALPLLTTWWLPVRRTYSRVAERLEALGLLGLKDRSPAELSFGQRRIVELLRVELQTRQNGVRLVLLDEPLAGLDKERRAVAFETIRSIAGVGVPTILVEHDSHLAGLREHAIEVELVAVGNGVRSFRPLASNAGPSGGSLVR
jgi:branched-chain amino acid transport system ATP-binding protein